MNNLNNLPVELQLNIIKSVIDQECYTGFNKICSLNKHFKNICITHQKVLKPHLIRCRLKSLILPENIKEAFLLLPLKKIEKVLFYYDQEIVKNPGYSGYSAHNRFIILEEKLVEEGQLKIIKFLVSKVGIDEHSIKNNVNRIYYDISNKTHYGEDQVWGKGILKYSAMYGKLDIFRFMISQGIDISTTYALEASIASRHIKIVKEIVSTDTDTEEYLPYGYNPLIDSIRHGYLEIVNYLVSEGYNVNFENGYPLNLAISHGHFKIVKFLLENGADIHFVDYNYTSGAVENGYLHIIKYLVSRSYDIQSNIMNFLRISIMNNHLELVKYFIHQADKSIKNYALKISREYNKKKITKYLSSQI